MTSIHEWRDDVAAEDESVAPSEFGDLAELDQMKALGLDEDDGCAEAVEETSVEKLLQEPAVVYQRLVASELRRRFVRGRIHRDLPVAKPQPRVQRVMRVEDVISLGTLDDAAFYQRLQSERVVARLVAETGIGKTVKLPAKIAKQCGLRVLQLELDANVAKLAMEKQRVDYNVAVSNCRWTQEKKAFLCVLSYEDFMGYMWSRTRDSVFECFDVFYFDEAHSQRWEVQAALQSFANYGTPANSLLQVSATLPVHGEVKAATVVPQAMKLPTEVSLYQAMEKGLLVGDWLADRTVLLVPNDMVVGQVKAYYEDSGVDVRALDLASVVADVEQVQAWLRPNAVAVPRVLVAHAEFGTSYNFPVARVITTASVTEFAMVDGTCAEAEVPLTEGDVVQHRGRAGRGMVTGATAIVMSEARYDSSRKLRKSELAGFYLAMVAAEIKPRLDGIEEVASLFPFGVTRDTARIIMQMSNRYKLPPVLAVRYMAADGRVAARFHSALKAFSQPDVDFPRSRHLDPVGYDDWVPETVGAYYPGQRGVSREQVYVPFATTPGLRLVMHAISAMGERKITVPAWVPPYEEESSDEEGVVRPRGKSPVRALPYRVVTGLSPEQSTVASEKKAWSYDVGVDQQHVRRKRQAMSWLGTPEGRDAAQRLKERFAAKYDDYGAGAMEPKLSEFASGENVELQVPDPIEAKSPGGSTVITIAYDTYGRMARGEALKPSSTVELLKCLGSTQGLTDRFVKTRVFAGWSPPWISMWMTFARRDVLQECVNAGQHAVALELMQRLYARFRDEALNALLTSNLYKKKVESFFRRAGSMSMNALASRIRKGKIPIAQSGAFIERWLSMIDRHEAALRAMESVGLFDPLTVTKTQELAPIGAGKRKDLVAPAPSSLLTGM